MGIFARTAGLPVVGPLRGLTWLARQIAAAAEQEMADPARIEAALLTLERRLNAGEIDDAEFEAQEAVLLASLSAQQAAGAESAAAPAPLHLARDGGPG
jgi:hypothetical protein